MIKWSVISEWLEYLVLLLCSVIPLMVFIAQLIFGGEGWIIYYFVFLVVGLVIFFALLYAVGAILALFGIIDFAS